jgi:DNA-binding transcriptional ArsR family regulator
LAIAAKRSQSLGEIEGAFEMSRFGVMKHLRILEAAGLVTTHKVGRTKLHYLNAVPIRELQDRWIHKFAAGASAALLGLRAGIEKGAAMAATETAVVGDDVELERKPEHVFAVWIRATPEQVWEAITTSSTP